MAVCTRTGLPVAWQTRSAKANESTFALPLIDAARERGFNVETAAMDKGYDLGPIYDGCEDRDGSRWIKASRIHSLIPRDTDRWRKLYKRRGSVEREFGRLKHEWSLLPLGVRGLDRVQLHADLTILAKLACALSRARAIPLVT